MQAVIILAINAFAVSAVGQSAKPQAGPHSVCDLLARRTAFSGQMVVVRGTVKSGGHGGWLAAEPDCRYELITRGIRWPMQVYLAYPDNRSRDDSLHTTFGIDWQSVARSEAAARRANYQPDTDDLIITYEGLFITHSDLV